MSGCTSRRWVLLILLLYLSSAHAAFFSRRAAPPHPRSNDDLLRLRLRRFVHFMVIGLDGDFLRKERQRQREMEKIIKEKQRRNSRIFQLLGLVMVLQVWQQMPTAVLKGCLEQANRILPFILPIVGTLFKAGLYAILGLGSAALGVVLVVTIILALPTLLMLGESVRDDIERSQAPNHPYSRTSHSIRKLARSLRRMDGESRESNYQYPRVLSFLAALPLGRIILSLRFSPSIGSATRHRVKALSDTSVVQNDLLSTPTNEFIPKVAQNLGSRQSAQKQNDTVADVMSSRRISNLRFLMIQMQK